MNQQHNYPILSLMITQLQLRLELLGFELIVMRFAEK